MVFYDIDKPIDYNREIRIYDILMPYTYLLYSTKNGYHIIVLSILNLREYAKIYTKLHAMFKSWYTGTVLRLSYKKDEYQCLYMYNDTNTMISKELAHIYEKRFNIKFTNSIKVDSKVFFTKYNSNKG